MCDVFDDGLSTAEANDLLGNPGHGRRKTITDDAVTYGRLVVETYCPDSLGEYDDAVADLDPFEKSHMSTTDGAAPVTGLTATPRRSVSGRSPRWRGRRWGC